MGSLLFRFGSNTGSQLFGFLIFYAHPCTVSIALSVIASNVAGFTKKSVATTMAMLGYTTGNIIGPFLFLSKEKPAYLVRFLLSDLLIVKGSCRCGYRLRLREHLFVLVLRSP
jgi:MFS transporter, ACS family, allantoate permease